MRALITAAGLSVLGLSSPAARADQTRGSLSCAQALEQVMTLETTWPVYKAAGAGQRNFIDDADRPAEIARLNRIIAASCSTKPQERAAQQAEAQRLHVALSPECAVARDQLAAMQNSSQHEARDVIETQRQLVAARCPSIDSTDLWLLQWSGRSELQPLEN